MPELRWMNVWNSVTKLDTVMLSRGRCGAQKQAYKPSADWLVVRREKPKFPKCA